LQYFLQIHQYTGRSDMTCIRHKPAGHYGQDRTHWFDFEKVKNKEIEQGEVLQPSVLVLCPRVDSKGRHYANSTLD